MRSALIETVAGQVAALSAGRLRVAVDGLTGAGKTSFARPRIYLAEVGPQALANIVIGNTDFKNPRIMTSRRP